MQKTGVRSQNSEDRSQNSEANRLGDVHKILTFSRPAKTLIL